MLQVDLSTLGEQELRQLLDSTRQRGQAALSYEILQEMAARRERREHDGPKGLSLGLFGGRRSSSEPRMIDVNLGDPLEPQEDPLDEAPTSDEPYGPPQEEPTYLERESDPELEPTRPRPRRRWGWTAAALVFGLFAGVALGWSLDEIAHDLREPSVALATAARPVAAPQAAPAPSPAPVAPSALAAPAPQAPPEPSAGPPPAEPQATSASPEAADSSQFSPAAPIPGEETSKAAAAGSAPAGAKGCAAQPTPADRTICGDARLQRLQRELRQAYAEALQAHQDRDLLRERQLAWRDERSDIADPDRLARIYEERIRKLNAATADALREQR
jgi:hypothetical protein